MAGFAIKTTGADAISQKLSRVATDQTKIARAAVSAGVGTFARAARNASKGTIKREISKTVKANGTTVTGRAGLMRFPRRGVKGKQPHGIYLEHGTRYIPAQHFVANALAGAQPAAVAAMEKAVRRKIEQLTK